MGHEMKYTTAYPRGKTYPPGHNNVICDLCRGRVLCADGYFRCKFDCDNDICKICATKQIVSESE
jgi:hypothetical protein